MAFKVWVNGVETPARLVSKRVPVPETFWQRLWRRIRHPRQPAPMYYFEVLEFDAPPPAGATIQVLFM